MTVSSNVPTVLSATTSHLAPTEIGVAPPEEDSQNHPTRATETEDSEITEDSEAAAGSAAKKRLAALSINAAAWELRSSRMTSNQDQQIQEFNSQRPPQASASQ